MAETAQQDNGQQFKIEKVYLKDASFESPGTPGLFIGNQAWKPQMDLQLNSEGRKINDNVYEVVLTITLTAKQEEKTAYLIELKQAGIFTITGVEPAALGNVLGAFCPNILFPFAREAISELAVKGGFPQILLDPINFDALYAQHLEQQKASENKETIQ
jgi:protein-export chaperone SecB